MKKFILLFMFIGTLSVYSQQNVWTLPVDSTLATSSYFFGYMLPKTTFKITVTVKKVREIKGYYAEYATKMLGLTNIISDNKTFYKLKDVTLETITTPDQSNTYLVDLSSKQIKNNFMAALISQRPDAKTSESFVSSYSTTQTPVPDFFKNFSNTNYMETEDAFVETKIINGVVTQVPANRTRIISKTTEQKVQEAADFIAKIRKDRYDVISGVQEVPYSKEAIEYLVSQLNLLERNYLDLFSGIILEDELTYTFFVSPKDANDRQLFLFSLDQDNGFSYKPNTLSEEKNLYLTLKPQIEHSQWSRINDQMLKMKKPVVNNGYRIRNGVSTDISLTQNKQSVHSFGVYSVYQYGKIDILPCGLDTLAIDKIGFIY